jgi:MYXO-CTERM domain-containing protein
MGCKTQVRTTARTGCAYPERISTWVPGKRTNDTASARRLGRSLAHITQVNGKTTPWRARASSPLKTMCVRAYFVRANLWPLRLRPTPTPTPPPPPPTLLVLLVLLLLLLLSRDPSAPPAAPIPPAAPPAAPTPPVRPLGAHETRLTGRDTPHMATASCARKPRT